MKKMFGIIAVLLIFYITFQVLYVYMIGSQTNSYKIDVDGVKYQVTEIFTNKHKDTKLNITEQSNYYYEIKSNDKLLFSFKLIGNYTGIKEFLSKMFIYKNGTLTCGYPVFKGKAQDMDVICNDGSKYYLYATLKGRDSGLDTFVNSLKSQGYSHPSWNNTNLETKHVNNFDVYSNNITDDQNIVLWQYKGFYRLTNKVERPYNFNISDQYSPILTTIVNQYYVIPDYRLQHRFECLYITNLISGSMETYDLGTSISYDSFIQGVVDNKIYLVDRSNKTQYSIDIFKRQVKITGDINNQTKYYQNGKWSQKSIYEVIDNNLVFEPTNTIPDKLNIYNPLYINEVGGSTEGYYYLYIKENNSISVYRVDKQNTDVMTLLFTIPSVSNIKYVNNDIYFISNDTLYTYRDSLGLRPIVKYSEFAFNQNSLYNVYINTK